MSRHCTKMVLYTPDELFVCLVVCLYERSDPFLLEVKIFSFSFNEEATFLWYPRFHIVLFFGTIVISHWLYNNNPKKVFVNFGLFALSEWTNNNTSHIIMHINLCYFWFQTSQKLKWEISAVCKFSCIAHILPLFILFLSYTVGNVRCVTKANQPVISEPSALTQCHWLFIFFVTVVLILKLVLFSFCVCMLATLQKCETIIN